jgi:prolyl 4-hydroxylase
METKIIIILILIFLFFIIQRKKNNQSNFENKGFASENASYTMPIIQNNIITEQEANYILEKTKDAFKDSEIIGGFNTSIRKSKTTWLYKDDPVIYNIIKRLCEQNGHQIENAEPLQVVKYDPGGFYNDHHDACCDNDSKCTDFIKNGGQRVLTILIYLNDDFEGGATKFSTIGKDIKPSKYGGVIFRPLADNSDQCHPLALHKGTPVTSGTKYICNLWIRQGEYK